MEYERLEDKDHPHKLTFNGDEPEVVRAAFREHIYYLATKGNTGSMEPFDAQISSWEDDGEPKSIRHHRPGNIADVIEEFADRTEDVIQEIPEVTSLPAFQSDDIGERFRLGRLAAALAVEIREKSAPPTQLDSSEIPDEIPDDELHQWINKRTEE